MSQSQLVTFAYTMTLRRRGFEAGSVVLESLAGFTIDDMTASIVESRRSTPQTVPVALYGLGTAQVAVTGLRLVFNDEAYGVDSESSERDFIEFPNWYFEGWIVDGDSTYLDQRVRVRGLAYPVGSPNPNAFDIVEAQIIPMNPEPNGRIGIRELR